MTLDHIHVGITALLFLAGLVTIAITLPKVSALRRVAYWLALPLWTGFTTLYVWQFLASDHTAPLSLVGAGIRALLFGIALEGLIVPLIDRLEVRALRIKLQGGDEL